MPDLRPLFIGASPRSGTTMLRSMLNNHPDLAVPHETWFVIPAWEHRREFGDLREEANRRKLAKFIVQRKTHVDRLGVPRGKAIERLVAAPPTLGSVLGTYFAMYAHEHGKPRWGDKRPQYVNRLRALFTMWPDAQFINVVRDPRSSVASMRKLGWYGYDVVPALELWHRSTQAADHWRRRLRADQFIDVRYEDLVTEPAQALARLCEFAGLPAGEALTPMLGFHERNDVTNEKYHALLSRPVTADRVTGWVGLLADEELAFIEHIARRSMQRFGYAPTMGGAKPPAAMTAAYRKRSTQRQLLRGRRMLVDVHRQYLSHRMPVASQLVMGADNR